MDTTPLRHAFDALLEAASTVADHGRTTQPAADGWTADQILAHVVLVNAATISAVASVASGSVSIYDNRLSADPWTIDRLISLASGNAGLRERIRAQREAMCAMLAPDLSEAELDILIPTLLISNNTVLVDQPMRLKDLVSGLAEVELPGHATQLLALVPRGSDETTVSLPGEERPPALP
jgi:hypothetical protein